MSAIRYGNNPYTPQPVPPKPLPVKPPQGPFLTVEQVAGKFGVSKMTVYRLIHAGDLPAVRVGRSFRVPTSAYLEYLQSAWVEGEE